MKKSVKINAIINLAQYSFCCIDKKYFKLCFWQQTYYKTNLNMFNNALITSYALSQGK